MTYIFIFLGEFGFELFNWQGVIRKFSRTISPSDKIICCSRGNLYPIYEMAGVYIDIAEVDIFKQSRATWYWASPNRTVSMNFIRTWTFDRRLRAEVTSFVLNRLRATDQLKDGESFQFVFSSGKLDLNGCSFGVTRYGFFIDALAAVYDGLKSKFPAFVDEIDKLRRVLLGRLECLDMRREHDGAYGMLDIENNIYQKIEPDFTVLNAVEKQLGWNLTEPFVFCQTRMRDTDQLSKDILPRGKLAKLIEAVAREVKVVLLSFHTGRWLDSYSEFEDYPNCFRYLCKSFPEQACLIHFAKHCLFFTEGDFGSQIYVPPFLGKDVTAIAPSTVYRRV